MYKNGCLIIFILLIILSGCSDTSMGGDSSFEKDAVEITSLLKGEILHEGSVLEIEYVVNEQDTVLNKLVISILDSEKTAVTEIIIEEEPLSEYVPDIDIESGLSNGRYSLLLEFYSGDELFLSDEREFFISDASYFIKSITSYPPVLYPGGGGLFYADIESPEEDCWLRWSLDGSIIASGMLAEGYQSIRIDAPENEGVYELNLEVFPEPPADGSDYDYQSTVISSIPVYINTNQKAGVNEFGPEEDFYALFHFRGSLINSADTELTGVESLLQVGNPSLSVKNGVFGYYLDGNSGFESEYSVLPVEDGSLNSFSLMFSLIPGSLAGQSAEQESGNLFYSGAADGSFYIAVDVYSDGRLGAVVAAGGEEYRLYSDAPLLFSDNYSSIGLSVYPEDGRLSLELYLDGVPAADTVYYTDSGAEAPWRSIDTADMAMKTSFAGKGGFEGLVDELGIYYLYSEDGPAVDPEQFSRSMELEYGKFLMYAEGFDAEPEELSLQTSSASISGSTLVINPGGEVVFPPVFPGYEEIVFSIVLSDSSTKSFAVVFSPEGLDEEIVRVDLPTEIESDTAELVNFSLILSPETVSVGETGAQDGETGYTGDFGGIVYRLINEDEIQNLEIESILVIRKSINVSEAGLKENGSAYGSESDIITGVNISS